MQEDSKLKAKKDFDEIFGQIKKSREIKLKGGENSIKFPNLPMISKMSGGWIKGRYYCISANSSVGKTQLAKCLTIFEVYDFIKSKPNSKLSAKVLWFGLEESYEEFRYSVISNRVYWRFGERLPEDCLMNIDTALTDKQLEMIEAVSSEVIEILDMVIFDDFTSNPTGIFKNIRNYAKEVGQFYFEGKKVSPPEDKYDSYVPNDEFHYVFCVIDNVNILQLEDKLNTLFDAAKKLSDHYLRSKVARVFGFIPILIQQQAAAEESLDNIKANKLLPSLNGLADVKVLGRDFIQCFGLYDPSRHEKTSITTSVGTYDIMEFKDGKDNFRAFNCFKNRKGKSQYIIPLCYYGDVNVFKELPPSDRNFKMANGVFMNPEIYKQVQNKEY